MQRTHPTGRAPAPAHGIGPGQIGKCLGQERAQDFHRRPALPFDDGKQKGALGHRPHFTLIAADTVAAQETFDGFVGRINFGAAPLVPYIRLGIGQSGDMEDQTPGRDVGHRRLERQLGGLQAIANQTLQVFRRAGLHAGGDFLAKQFQ